VGNSDPNRCHDPIEAGINFDKILSALRDKKLVRPRTRQRTDLTHVLAAVRDLNRLERVGQTLHAALNVLAVAAPEWVSANVLTEWVDRYGKRVDDSRLPEEAKNRKSCTKRYSRLADLRAPKNLKRSIGIEQELKGQYLKECEWGRMRLVSVYF